MQGSGWALMQSLARQRGTGSAGGGPAGGLSSRAALEARAVPGLELGPGGEEVVLPVRADSSSPGVSQHTGSCPRKLSCPPGPWSLGSRPGKSQPPVEMLAGWDRGTEREQGLGLSPRVQMDISRAKGGDFSPQGT